MMLTESDVVELKSQVIGDICKEVIAFANTKGGTLYIGVEDNGAVIGVDDPDDVILQISQVEFGRRKYSSLISMLSISS